MWLHGCIVYMYECVKNKKKTFFNNFFVVLVDILRINFFLSFAVGMIFWFAIHLGIKIPTKTQNIYMLQMYVCLYVKSCNGCGSDGSGGGGDIGMCLNCQDGCLTSRK